MTGKFTLSFAFFLFFAVRLCGDNDLTINAPRIITSTKRIFLPNFPDAFNPSITKLGDKYIMTFRVIPQVENKPWISFIGVVLLNKSFEPISEEQLLETRLNEESVPSQSEDARIFKWKRKLYLIYNDNTEIENPSHLERRDMYKAKLLYKNGKFSLINPVKMIHTTKYDNTLWQKNWSPFIWNGQMLFSYSITPHEVLKGDSNSGTCSQLHKTNKAMPWDYGILRGGTPAQLVDGEYLAFFHSSIEITSACTDGQKLWHYYIGAYTYSGEPPFEMTKMSPVPLIDPEFYTYSSYNKRVIYPGGFVRKRNSIYLAYGKDDSEIWIAKIPLNRLKKSMVPVK